KNHIGLIESFARLLSITDRKIHLCLIGSGSALQTLECVIGNMKLTSHVHLFGFQSNIYPFLAASDLFVLLSPPPDKGGVESLSNALLEAMSCGIPVIVSRNGSEEVVTDGTDGFIVNWNDQSDIVNRLYQLTSNNAIRKAFG